MRIYILQIIYRAKALVTAPRALCHVVCCIIIICYCKHYSNILLKIKTIRAKYSQLSVTVPPHTHNWYSESNKKEFAVQKLYHFFYYYLYLYF